MNEDESGPQSSATRAVQTTSESPRVVQSEDLMMGAREIIIRHGSEDYRLRLTRAGKLILNK